MGNDEENLALNMSKLAKKAKKTKKYKKLNR
jgi:hypothetical protein